MAPEGGGAPKQGWRLRSFSPGSEMKLVIKNKEGDVFWALELTTSEPRAGDAALGWKAPWPATPSPSSPHSEGPRVHGRPPAVIPAPSHAPSGTDKELFRDKTRRSWGPTPPLSGCAWLSGTGSSFPPTKLLKRLSSTSLITQFSSSHNGSATPEGV